jgi:hypothetical protein
VRVVSGQVKAAVLLDLLTRAEAAVLSMGDGSGRLRSGDSLQIGTGAGVGSQDLLSSLKRMGHSGDWEQEAVARKLETSIEARR